MERRNGNNTGTDLKNENRTPIKNTLKSRTNVADNNIQDQNSDAMLYDSKRAPIPDARSLHRQRLRS